MLKGCSRLSRFGGRGATRRLPANTQQYRCCTTQTLKSRERDGSREMGSGLRTWRAREASSSCLSARNSWKPSDGMKSMSTTITRSVTALRTATLRRELMGYLPKQSMRGRAVSKTDDSVSSGGSCQGNDALWTARWMTLRCLLGGQEWSDHRVSYSCLAALASFANRRERARRHRPLASILLWSALVDRTHRIFSSSETLTLVPDFPGSLW